MKCATAILVLAGCVWVPRAVALDMNHNGFNDAWEVLYSATSLPSSDDSDGDGCSNLKENGAGTDPFDPMSLPLLDVALGTQGGMRFYWTSAAGKRYTLDSSTNLAGGTWSNAAVVVADDTQADVMLTSPVNGFYRLNIGDTDSDADGASDYEERALGFNTRTNRTERFDEDDFRRIKAILAATCTVTVVVLDPNMSERWPEPGLVAIRRIGGLGPVTVNFALGGSATLGVDYTASNVTSVFIPMGARERWIELIPIADGNNGEGAESITVTLLSGIGYVRGTSTSAVVTLINETASSPPHAKAAARFLIQGAFGPNQDSPLDTDEIPENVEEVMTIGYSAWISNQIARPVGLIQPWVDWASTNADDIGLYGNWKEFSWWHRAMGDPRPRPDAAPSLTPDPLRQRVAFALSEIMVVSDRPEQLASESQGLANYYDLMVRHAFGNFANLLYDVATHPAMGIYLSHLGNRKADPVNKIYPDENFAREIMQLMSIGLWQLNSDGTRKLDGQGQPIPTYNNGDITELARVFTGLSFGNNTYFDLYPRDFTQRMKMWDAEHDCAAKTLLNGLQLPARTPSAGNTGTAGLADVRAAVSNLFLHANTGPFIGRQLIQRLVTSNPSTDYVARVAAAFADNGAGVRGDLKAVVTAVLLDPEARDGAKLTSPTWGKLREPFLRVVNYARAFNAASTSGYYPLDQYVLDHLQDPMNAPSVFNFFLPAHSPPGPITQQGLVAPEFQIINASTAITGPNFFWNSIPNDLHRWGAGRQEYAVRLNVTNELAMIVPAGQINQDVPAGPALDVDPLLRRLDLALTGGTMSPRQFQLIREAMERVKPPTWEWHRERLRLAIYLIVCSPEFNVLR